MSEAQRNRFLNKAREYTTSTYCRKFVAPDFQRMIRAEAGASEKSVLAVVHGRVKKVNRELCQCVCVTCGHVCMWSGGLGGMHTGHFIPSRRNSILFDEDNVAPQCSSCNRYRSGSPMEFRLWMDVVRGKDVIARLERLKRKTVVFSIEELVDMRIGYRERLKSAQLKMAWSKDGRN